MLDKVSLDLLEKEWFDDLGVDVLKLSEVFGVLLPDWTLEEEGLRGGELDLRDGELDLEGSGGELDLGLGVKELDLDDGGEELDLAVLELVLVGELNIAGGELVFSEGLLAESDEEEVKEECLVDKVDWLGDEEYWDETSDS